MTVKIDIDIPDGCMKCKFKQVVDGSGTDSRYICHLTHIEFDGFDYHKKRFELCPLKKCK